MKSIHGGAKDSRPQGQQLSLWGSSHFQFIPRRPHDANMSELHQERRDANDRRRWQLRCRSDRSDFAMAIGNRAKYRVALISNAALQNDPRLSIHANQHGFRTRPKYPPGSIVRACPTFDAAKPDYPLPDKATIDTIKLQ
ncbi:MAG: hypothetical protein JHD35_07830 [Sphingopyxis sp.]|nr:hypothetical protein [Sphingopyxis sp.]